MNFENSTCTERSEVKIESAKSILENMDAILNELGNELRQIDDAIHSPGKVERDATEPQDECLLGTLNRQRHIAEKLLETAVHIREGLW